MDPANQNLDDEEIYDEFGNYIGPDLDQQQAFENGDHSDGSQDSRSDLDLESEIKRKKAQDRRSAASQGSDSQNSD